MVAQASKYAPCMLLINHLDALVTDKGARGSTPDAGTPDACSEKRSRPVWCQGRRSVCTVSFLAVPLRHQKLHRPTCSYQ